MRWIWTIIFLFLCGALVYSVYYLYTNLPGEPRQLIPVGKIPLVNVPEPQPVDVDSHSVQFYPRMRFPDKRISYNIDSACDENKQRQFFDAIAYFENSTVLRFYPDPSNPKILVTCSELAPEPESAGHFVAGEGGPTEIVNTSLYTVVLKGKIALYRDETCSTVHIAIHEMLHVLGYDHNNNSLSILYPTLNCKQKVDSYFITELDNLYSTESLPDLAISDVTSNASGRYLNFNIEVVNQGLADASGVSLGVYADESLVRVFDLAEISIGTKKVLTVENLKMPLRTQKVRFVVDLNDSIRELFENNNEQDLLIQ